MSVGSTPTPTAWWISQGGKARLCKSFMHKFESCIHLKKCMKKILTILILLLFSILGYSQNGGQYFENNVIIVKVIGYSNGQYIFSVINKQNCEARIRTKADQDPAVDVVVQSKDSVWIFVPRSQGVEILFRAKAETFCISNPDMGWLEIKITLTVLSLLETPRVIITNYNVTDQVVLINNVLISKFTVPHLQFIYVYDIIGNKLFYQKSYVYKQNEINLFPYLKKGINFIKVVTENKIYNTYLFKIVK